MTLKPLPVISADRLEQIRRVADRLNKGGVLLMVALPHEVLAMTWNFVPTSNPPQFTGDRLEQIRVEAERLNNAGSPGMTLPTSEMLELANGTRL